MAKNQSPEGARLDTVVKLVKSFGRIRKTLPKTLTTFVTSGYPNRLLGLVAVLALSGLLRSEAADESNEEIRCVAGKTLYQSDFTKDVLSDVPWSIHHGQWRVRDGALAGVTSAEENHDASVSLNDSGS